MIIVLVLLVLGSLIVTPMLSYMGEGLRATGVVYEKKTNELYAADAGVVDAMWQIKYDRLEKLFAGHNPGYDRYDYDTDWTYSLSEQVNRKDVDVTIRNVWVPPVDPLDATSLRTIVEDGTLIVTGSIPSESTYQIRITYDGEEELLVQTVGIWLPDGFTYVLGSSNLEADTSEPYYAVPDITSHLGGHIVVWALDGVPFADFPGGDPAGGVMTSAITFEFDSRKPERKPDAVSWVTTSGGEVPFAWDADTRIFQIRSVAGGTAVETHTPKTEMRKLASATAGNYFATGSNLLGGKVAAEWPPHSIYENLYESTSATVETSADASAGIPEDATVEAAYLYWTGWIGWHGYNRLFHDTCSNFDEWDNGSQWEISGGRFRGRGGSTIQARTITLTNSLDLSSYSPGTVEVYWSQSTGGFWSSSDRLYFAFSGDGGITWSDDILAFSGSNPPSFFDYDIPGEYLTSNFKMRFFCDSGSSWRYVYLDEITVARTVDSLKYPSNTTPEDLERLVEETARVNKVLFNDTPVTANAYQTLSPDAFSETHFEGTWFYTAMADVTAYLQDAEWREDRDILPNAAGEYIVGHYYVGTDPDAEDYWVNADDPNYQFEFHDSGGFTGYPLGTPAPKPLPSGNTRYRYTATHSGWSLVLIYSSPETLGHQLYLFDIQNPDFDFFFGWGGPTPYTLYNHDFNNDGEPGGTISGFLVPDQIPSEELAGRITVMVGEGDAGHLYEPTRFIVNGVKMDDGSLYPDTNYDNVWNSKSRGLEEEGIDIDHFYITWDSGILKPGDTSAKIDTETERDGFTMTYMIISFRSEITTGGALSYLIE